MSALSEIAILIKATGADQVANETRKAATATETMASMMNKVESAIKGVAAAFGAYKIIDYAKDAALLAARYSTLGVVMNTVGATAGYTAQQMSGFEASLQKQGIAMVESRQVLTQMAAAHMDLTKASELGRIAQDAAVIGQMNSSEAFQQMITGIQRGETEIMKTLGLNVDFNAAQQMLASRLGKTTQELTATEKVQANMNAAMQKGKDIAGVYEASMGTAGKQLSSMQRYMDNLKVVAGEIFQDALIVGVGAFTEALKQANSEAEKMQQGGEMKAFGRDIVMVLATIADGLHIVYLTVNTVVTAAIAGFTAWYHGINALSSAMKGVVTGDLSEARAYFSEMVTDATAFLQMTKDKWSGVTMFQDAANKMYADREKESTKIAQAEKSAELEKRQMLAGTANQVATAAQEQELFLKKHSDSWGKVVVAQLESVGAYTEATRKAIELNQQTDEYKTLLNSSKEAQAALAAQQILDANKLMEAKAKELQFDTDHQKVMLDLEKSKLTAMGYDSDALASMTGYKEALLQEQILANQIATEINPKKTAQLKEQLGAQQEINNLVQREAEQRAKIKLINDQFSLLQQQIDLAGKQGITEELFERQRVLDAQKLQFEYSQKMIDYQKQLNAATADEAALIRQNMQLYADLTTASMNAIQSRTYASQQAVASSGSSGSSGGWWGDSFHPGQTTSSYTITTENVIAKAAEARKAAESAAEAARSAAEAAQKAAVSLANDLAVRALSVRGMDDEAELLKKKIDQQNELNEAISKGINTTNLVLVQQAEYNKLIHEQQLAKATKDAEAFFDTIKTAIAEMVSSGTTLVTSLRSAATALRQASGDLSTGSNTMLSPEQLYAQTRQNLATTVQQAMASGDAEQYSKIPALVNAFLEQSKTYYGSGSQYATDFSWAKNLLDTSATAADDAATHAGNVISAAQAQQAALDAIKAALTTDNTAALPRLLTELSSSSGTLSTAITATNIALSSAGAIATGITGVNTTTGAVNSSVNNSSSSITGWLNTVNTSTAAVNTAVGGVRTAVAPLTTINSYSANLPTLSTISSYSSTIASNSGKLKSASSVNWVYNTQTGTNTTYTYYARGGIANQPSIFGEAGPEAAVPLPDGRTIPVTLSGRADNGTIAALQEAIAELKAQTRVLQSGLSQLIASSNRQEKNGRDLANKTSLQRQAA